MQLAQRDAQRIGLRLRGVNRSARLGQLLAARAVQQLIKRGAGGIGLSAGVLRVGAGAVQVGRGHGVPFLLCDPLQPFKITARVTCLGLGGRQGGARSGDVFRARAGDAFGQHFLLVFHFGQRRVEASPGVRRIEIEQRLPRLDRLAGPHVHGHDAFGRRCRQGDAVVLQRAGRPVRIAMAAGQGQGSQAEREQACAHRGVSEDGATRPWPSSARVWDISAGMSSPGMPKAFARSARRRRETASAQPARPPAGADRYRGRAGRPRVPLRSAAPAPAAG